MCASLVLITILPSLCRAQERGFPALPEAGLTPLNTFFFIERTIERFTDFFTFNTKKQIQKQQRHIDERIAELLDIIESSPLSTEGITRALSQIESHLQKIVAIIQETHQNGDDEEDIQLLTSLTAEHVETRLLATFQSIFEKMDDIEETFIGQKAALKQKFLEQKLVAKHREADEFLQEIVAIRSLKEQDILTLHSTEETLTETFLSAETAIGDLLSEEHRTTNTIERALRERIRERWKNLQEHFSDLKNTLREREDTAAAFIDAALRLGEKELLQREREELLAIDGEELFILAKERDGWEAITLIHDILQNDMSTSLLPENIGEHYQSFLMVIATFGRRTLTEKQEEILRLFERNRELRELHKEHLGRQLIDIQQLCLNSTSPEEQSTCLSTQMYPAQERLLTILIQEQEAIFLEEHRLALHEEEEVFESQTTLADNEETAVLLNLDLTQGETVTSWIDTHDQETERREQSRRILETRQIQEKERLQSLQQKIQEEYLRERAELRSFWKTYTQSLIQEPSETPDTLPEFLPHEERQQEEEHSSPASVSDPTEGASSLPSSLSIPQEPDDHKREETLPQNTQNSSHTQSAKTIDNTAERKELLQKEVERERERKSEEQKRIDQWGKPTSSP